MGALDNFLNAYFHATDLAEKGAEKSQHDRADELLLKHERTFFAYIRIDTEVQSDSNTFDRILELADNYHNDESQYEMLVSYVEAVRKK